MIINVKYKARTYGNDYPVKKCKVNVYGGPRWFPDSVGVSFTFGTSTPGIAGGSVQGGQIVLSKEHALQLAEALRQYASGEQKAFAISLC